MPKSTSSEGYGIGWWLVAALVILLLVASALISGLANIYAWQSTAGDGVLFYFVPKQALNIVFGIVTEMCGVLGFIMAVWCLRARAYLAFSAAMLLTLSSVAFNGYSSQRAFSILAQDKIEDTRSEILQSSDYASEIERLENELSAIAPQRPSSIIQEQIDDLLPSWKTRRGELKDELGWAQTREKIERDLELARANHKTRTGAGVEDNKEIVQGDNVWWIVAGFLEFFKATAGWILLSTNGGAGAVSAKRPARTRKKPQSCRPVRPVNKTPVPTQQAPDEADEDIGARPVKVYPVKAASVAAGGAVTVAVGDLDEDLQPALHVDSDAVTKLALPAGDHEVIAADDGTEQKVRYIS